VPLRLLFERFRSTPPRRGRRAREDRH